LNTHSQRNAKKEKRATKQHTHTLSQIDHTTEKTGSMQAKQNIFKNSYFSMERVHFPATQQQGL